MGEYSVFQIVGIASVSLLVVAWLAVSFAAPGRTHSRLAWLAATLLYVALCTLFASLFTRAWNADNLLAQIAFGFLLAFFASGCVVSLVKTLGQFRAARSSGDHATH